MTRDMRDQTLSRVVTAHWHRPPHIRSDVTWYFFFSSRRRHTRFDCDWSSDVCSSDLAPFLRQYGGALLGLLLFALVVHDIFGTHGYLAMRRTQQEIKKVNADRERLNKENVQLEEEVKELKSDPRKIETIARDELGLAKPGEVIIKIPQSLQLPQDPGAKP